MAKDVSISFDGTENLEQIFKKLPGRHAKALMIRHFRRGGRPLTKALRAQLPGSLKKAISTKVGRSKTNPTLYVGQIYKKTTIDEWFKVYWKAYGTLERRDPSHDFSKKRKAGSKNWRGGIRPNKTLQAVIGSNMSKAMDLIEKECANDTRKFLQKYAVK